MIEVLTMKKNYVKPEAEYISLEAKDIITDLNGPGGGMGNDDDDLDFDFGDSSNGE